MSRLGCCRFVLLMLGLVCPLACSSRTLTIESNPPGAVVYVDWQEVGRTPVTMPFVHGGKRDILLLHEEGTVKYKPLRVRQEVSNFVYDVFPFDLFSAIAPFPHDDTHVLHFDLEPSPLITTLRADEAHYLETLLGRADELRARARAAQQEGLPEMPPLLEPVEDSPATPAVPADPSR